MVEEKERLSGNKKAKVHAATGWEWFKQAAWLQVLLIVAVVIALIISIPYIVKAVQNSNDNDSKYYRNYNIKYSDLKEKYLTGNSSNETDGLVGEATDVNSGYTKSENRVGFVVMFYKDNCDNCTSMIDGVKKFFNNYNKKYEKNALKFYTLNVGWEPNSEKKSAAQEGQNPANNYNNKNITLDEQYEVQQTVKDIYLAQDDTHRNSEVTEDTLNNKLNVETGGGTLPTPMFALYTKDKNEKSYSETPTKVIFGMEGSLSASNTADVNTEMFDIYNLQIYTQNS